MLREVEQRLRVADRLAGCIEDQRAPDQITHTLADIIRFRLLMIAAGYEDGNDAADPMFKMAPRSLGRRTVFAVDHFAAGEPTGYPHPAAHGTCHGRLVLRLVQAGSQTHRAGYRRHVRCGSRRPTGAAVLRPAPCYAASCARSAPTGR